MKIIKSFIYEDFDDTYSVEIGMNDKGIICARNLKSKFDTDWHSYTYFTGKALTLRQMSRIVKEFSNLIAFI